MDTKPHIRVVAAEIEKEGHYLITQRNPHAVLPLLWEFPGGRVEAGESDAQALVRELEEEMAITVEVGERSLSVTHEYERYTLDLMVYRAKIVKGEPKCLKVHAIQWVKPSDFSNYKFPGADQATVDQLLGEDACS